MKKTISMMLVCLLVLGALPLSLAVTAESPAAANAEMPITNVRGAADVSPPVRQINSQSIAIDADPAGGYEGDYVVIYNPSESSSSSMSTGNMSGLINTTISANMVDARGEGEFASNEMYRIDVDQYLAEEARKLMGDKPLPPDGDGTKATSYNVGDTANFKISYYSPFSTSTVQFKVVAKGDHCYVWTPSSSGSNSYPLSSADAQTAMQAFESKFDTMNNSFGDHRIGNGDGRVNILYYNVTEANPWTPGSNSGYVGGYFWSGDYSSGNNNLPIIHIDTYPSVYYNNNGVENTFSTLVHEYQHMIHYNYAPNSHSWINETMSAAAEEICYPGSSIFSRIMYYTGCEYSYNAFANPPKEYAAQHANLHYGYSMYDWSNDLSDVLALYAQVSLFSQYLYTQSTQGNAVFRAILDELAKNSRNTFQTVCPTVLGMSASDFVRDFRIALTANTNRNVLDGKYGWELQQGYDPSEYYGIQNLYNLLGPIIFTDSSCLIKGGGAITVKPVGGAYNPPAGADAGLRYYGITLNAQGDVPPPLPTPTPIVDPSPAPFDPTEGELVANRTYYLEQDGTYTAMISAYSTSSVYDLQTRFKDYLTSDLCFGNNLAIYATSYNCTGIDANGDPVFSSQNNGYITVSASYSRSGNYWYMNGFDFDSNVCTGSSGKLFAFWLYGLLPSDSATGTFSACDDETSGVYINDVRELPLPHCDLTIRERSFAYDFGTTLSTASTAEFFGDSSVSRIIHIDTAFNEIQNSEYCLELPNVDPAHECSAEAINLKGNVHVRFTPGSMNASTGLRAIIQLSDSSYEWCRINYFPATVVLYEEGFGTYSNSESGGENGQWTVDGTPSDTPQTGGGVYGFDASYLGSTGDSNGSAMKVTVDRALMQAVSSGSTVWPSANFSFTGTGLDLISHIGEDSGVLTIDLVPEGSSWSYVGNNARHVTIDTYYTGGTLHQVPVFRIENLPYGSYSIRVIARYSPRFDHQSNEYVGIKGGSEINEPGLEPGVEYTVMSACANASEALPGRAYGSFTSFIDGIRVYNPLGTELPEAAAEAYVADGELAPEFYTISSLLEYDDVICITLNGEEVDVTEYVDLSPKNEVYIRPGGGIAFSISSDYAIHIGVKAPLGQTVTMTVNGEQEISVDHTTELYYDITDCVTAYNGNVVITCNGDQQNAILSLMNVKLVYIGSGEPVQPESCISADPSLADFAAALFYGVMGDADRDGAVTAIDALLVMRGSLGDLELGTYGSFCADMNRDGSIDMADALSILRLAMAII